MKVLKIIGIIILIVVVLFFIVAALLPKTFHVEHSIIIESPAECAFNQVNNLHNWENWSPFNDDDTVVVYSFKGPASGVGAINIWDGVKQGGSLTITESIPFEKVVTELDFGTEGKDSGYFTFFETDGETKVTWGFDTETGYPVERVVYALMKGAMEDSFQKGLQNLKDYCEAVVAEVDLPEIIVVAYIKHKEKPDADKIAKMQENPHLYILQLNERWIATIEDSCYMADIEATMGKDFGELMPFVMQQGEENFGNPFSIWHKWDGERQFAVFEAGIPIKDQAEEQGRIKVRRTKPVKVVAGIHYGPYDKTEYMYKAIEKYIKVHNMEEAGGPIELYITDPSQEPDPEKWETVIMFPVK